MFGLGDDSVIGPPSLDVSTVIGPPSLPINNPSCPTGYTTAIDGTCITAPGFSPASLVSSIDASIPAGSTSIGQWISSNAMILLAVFGGIVLLASSGRRR